MAGASPAPVPALGPGDVVRHPVRGIGVVRAVDGDRVSVWFDSGRFLVNATRLMWVAERAMFLDRLSIPRPMEPDEITAAIMYLRSDSPRLVMAAALVFASTTDARASERLHEYLAVVGPNRRDALETRIAEAKDWLSTPPLLRGVAAEQGETTEARIERIDRDRAERALPPLTLGQRRRMHEYYENRCWQCHEEVSSTRSIPCPACLWYVCRCGACKSPDYGECAGS